MKKINKLKTAIVSSLLTCSFAVVPLTSLDHNIFKVNADTIGQITNINVNVVGNNNNIDIMAIQKAAIENSMISLRSEEDLREIERLNNLRYQKNCEIIELKLEANFDKAHMEDLQKQYNKLKEDYDKLTKKKNRKEQAKTAAKKLQEIDKALPGIISNIKDIHKIATAEDLIVTDLVFECLELVSSIASLCGPYGQIASAVINIGMTIAKAIIGGQAPRSEIADLADKMKLEFNQVKNQINNVRKDLKKLSDKVDESTEKILNRLDSALNELDSKQKIYNFMNSGEGNFSYSQYKNYLLGEANPNTNYRANKAYNDLISQLENNSNNGVLNNSEKISLRNYYNSLYRALNVSNNGETNANKFLEYIVPTDKTKSIITYYYDYINANSNVFTDLEDAKTETIRFANDLYQTELSYYSTMSNLNSFMIKQIYNEWINNDDIEVTDESRYCLHNETSAKCLSAGHTDCISLREIKDNANVLDLRLEMIQKQIAKELVHIFELDKNIIVENVNGDIYPIYTKDGMMHVNLDDKIYFNSLIPEVIESFDLDESLFEINGDTYNPISGDVYKVNRYDESFNVAYKYGDIEMSTFRFVVDDQESSVVLGDGTENNPYLIKNKTQFEKIPDLGMDKVYALTNDISMSNTTISPMGMEINDLGNEDYESFTGTLDGRGFTLSDLKIEGGNESGLFANLKGTVKNLYLDGISLETSISSADDENSKYFAGIIAGKNEGLINDVHINNSSVNFKQENSMVDRNINSYVGGLCGQNLSYIKNSSIDNTTITTRTSHSIAGQSTSKNKVSTFAGGFTSFNNGIIENVVLGDNVKLDTKAELIHSQDADFYPNVTVIEGGLCAVSDIDNIKNVFTNSGHVDSSKKHYKITAEKSNAYAHEKKIIDKTSDYVTAKQKGYNEFSYYSETDFNKNKASSLDSVKENFFIARNSDNKYVSSVSYNKTTYDNRYGNGEREFRLYDLILVVDGKEYSSTGSNPYRLVNLYGFNTDNKDLKNDKTLIVTGIFEVNHNGVLITVSQEIEIIVEHNYYTSIEANLINEINKNEGIIKGSTIDTNYLLGSIFTVKDRLENEYEITLTDDNKNDFIISNVDTSSYGPVTFTIKYFDVVATINTSVVCKHGVQFEDKNFFEKVDSKCIESTCIAGGYDLYRCKVCGEEIKKSLPKSEEHVIEKIGYVAPSCYSNGASGTEKCTLCGIVISENEIIQRLEHSFEEFIDSDGKSKHRCKESGCSFEPEEHIYQVIDSNVNEVIESNGSKNYRICYLYECVANGCGHREEIIDTNTITNEGLKLPSLVISDNYTLVNSDDEIIVYVQLLNNVSGIRGAHFGIKYDSELSLIRVEDGNILNNSFFKDSKETLNGYDFAWVDSNLVKGDGNLLKLVFKANNKTLGKTYEIKAFYQSKGGSSGGFSTSKGLEKFVTRSGTIRVVNHLPGDVNDDGVVDALDAILIVKYALDNEYPINAKYADVDLKDGVNLDDAITVLLSLTGGYGKNILSSDYKVLLNYGDFDRNNIYVDVNSNTLYSDILEDESRVGYKFVGWYTAMVGGELIDPTDYSTLVKYNETQEKQTLYARWEINRIVIDYSEATEGKIDAITYNKKADNIVDLNNLKDSLSKNYDVVFHSSNKVVINSVNDCLVYEIVGFTGKYKNYKTDDYVEISLGLEEINLNNVNYGEIILKPVWKIVESSIEFPNWSKTGYNLVGWYSNNNYIDGFDIENPFDIEKLEMVNKQFHVYANFQPIEFTINIDSNGGTYIGAVQINNVSVENKLTLSISPSKYGYDFAKWEYNENQTFNFGSTIGYIDGIKDGDTITLKAIFNPKVTKFILNNEDKDCINEVTSSVSIFYSKYDSENPYSTLECDNSLNNFTLPTRPGYTFGGYSDGKIDGNGSINPSYNNIYIDADGKFNSDLLKSSISKEITLNAIWIAKKIYVNYSSNPVNGVNNEVYNSVIKNSKTAYIAYNSSEIIYLATESSDIYNIKYWCSGSYYISDGNGKLCKDSKSADGSIIWTDSNGKWINYKLTTITLGAYWEKDSSSQSNPTYWSYKYIETINDLLKMTASGKYLLVNNISFSNNSTNNWTPIDSFTGELIGYSGFSSKLSITNLAIKQAYFDSDSTGTLSDKVNDAKNSGLTVTTSSSDNKENYGFVRELNGGTIKSISFNYAKIYIRKYKDGIKELNVGTICGQMKSGTIENVDICNSNMEAIHFREVYSGGNSVNIKIGAVVGRQAGGTVKGCKNESTGIATWSSIARQSADVISFVGGIVGKLVSGSVVNCVRNGNVYLHSAGTVESSNSACRLASGGIVGCSSISNGITGCTNPYGTSGITTERYQTSSCYNSSTWKETLVGSIYAVIDGAD